MPSIPNFSKRAYWQHLETLLNRIVISSTNQQSAYPYTFLKSISMFYPHHIVIKRKFQLTYKFITIVSKNLTILFRSLYFYFHNDCKSTKNYQE